MTDNIDLRGLHLRHDPDPVFVAELERQLEAIVAGVEPPRTTELESVNHARSPGAPPQRRMFHTVVALTTAAALVAIFVLVTSRNNSVAPSVNPTPTSTTEAPPTTPTPSMMLLPESGSLAPGTYTLAKPRASISDYTQLSFTLPAGWAIEDGLVHKNLGQADEVAFSVWTVDQVYDDPCKWQDSQLSELDLNLVDLTAGSVHDNFHKAPSGSTIDGPGRGGLANQVGRNPSELTKVKLGGQDTLKIELSVPYGLDLATCDRGEFRSWTSFGDIGGANAHHSPGQIDVVYMVDVDRKALVIDASHTPVTSPSDLAELDAILASLIIDR